jgi:hypothetical protein
MTSSLKSLALAALAATVLAGRATASIIDFQVTGHAISTAAEVDYPTLWGVDEHGNSVIGDSYVATIHYIADPAFDTTDGATYTGNDEAPGETTGTLTIGGETYHVSSSAGLQDYLKTTGYLNVTDSADPHDNTGIFWQLFYLMTSNISLAQPLSFDTTTDSVLGDSGGNAVIVAGNGGVLRADFDVSSFSVAPGVPEPAAWTMLTIGLAGLGLKMRRSRARAVPALA